MKILMTVPILVGLCLASPYSLADVLLIDAIHDAPVNSAEGVLRPERGMRMDQVKQRYGVPSVEHSKVGEPPITRWDYPDYSVFFEYKTVLTSVVHPR